MIQERFRVLREFWKLSQRQMAAKASVTVGAWQNYESGSNVPGGQVLASLGNLGVNLNWLILGIGEMFREDATGTGDAMPRIPPEDYRRLEQLVARLGLDALLPISEMSLFGEQLSVLQALARRRPRSLTPAELAEALRSTSNHIDRERIIPILRALEQRRLIEKDNSNAGHYRTTELVGELVFRDITGHADLCLRTVRELVKDILPRATLPTGFLQNMRLTASEASALSLVQDLRQMVRQRCAEAIVDGAPSEVVVIIGAAYVTE